ncbi:MAG TPA: type II toxin-antitoxin system prevent-host-death family antitoxin [Gemmatimonadales bacterium]|nr:type II toxin-antitoxin system prevent-host-death family antitoxin [Gemmatimonadales bacterium]
MAIAYSLYDAKAKLSEILRRVREGDTVTITYRGEPVAEIRRIGPKPRTLDERIRELEARGVIVRPSPARRRGTLRSLARRPGALKRFLRERDEG